MTFSFDNKHLSVTCKFVGTFVCIFKYCSPINEYICSVILYILVLATWRDEDLLLWRGSEVSLEVGHPIFPWMCRDIVVEGP